MEFPANFQRIVRYAFIFFNVLFTIIGLGLVIAGAVGVSKAKSQAVADLLTILPETVHSDENVKALRAALAAVGGLIITVGLVTMFISSCGWIGACKQNTCLLFTFSIFMIGIVLLEFIFGITLLVVSKKLNDPDAGGKWVTTIMDKGKAAYANKTVHPTIRNAWDLLQSEGACCGLNKPSDWGGLQLNITELKEACSNPATGTLYTDGCLPTYKANLMHIGKSIGGASVAFCVIEIVGIVISCYLAFSMRKGSQAYEQH